MQPELKTVLASILDGDDNIRTNCQSWQDMLYAYIDAARNGADAPSIFAGLKQHLDECQACSAEYEALKALLLMEQQDQLVEPPVAMALDFSALQTPASPAPVWQPVQTIFSAHPDWRERQLAQGWSWIEQKSQELRQLWLSLSSLGGAMAGAPALTGLMSGGGAVDDGGGRTLQVSPQGVNLDLSFSLSPEPGGADDGLWRMEVAVTPHNHWGDFSGLRVALIWGDKAQVRTTDDLGKVAFTALSRDHLATMNLLVTMPD